ncbi:hypothetical protein ABW19_dt0208303 [Dactylella cylindrospora]|nr:hypothetical protein ABW19_dt0208303 [Dactylella cylindrospora]
MMIQVHTTLQVVIFLLLVNHALSGPPGLFRAPSKVGPSRGRVGAVNRQTGRFRYSNQVGTKDDPDTQFKPQPVKVPGADDLILSYPPVLRSAILRGASIRLKEPGPFQNKEPPIEPELIMELKPLEFTDIQLTKGVLGRNPDERYFQSIASYEHYDDFHTFHISPMDRSVWLDFDHRVPLTGPDPRAYIAKVWKEGKGKQKTDYLQFVYWERATEGTANLVRNILDHGLNKVKSNLAQVKVPVKVDKVEGQAKSTEGPKTETHSHFKLSRDSPDENNRNMFNALLSTHEADEVTLAAKGYSSTLGEELRIMHIYISRASKGIRFQYGPVRVN